MINQITVPNQKELFWDQVKGIMRQLRRMMKRRDHAAVKADDEENTTIRLPF